MVLEYSYQLLEAVKLKKDFDAILNNLKQLKIERLFEKLASDDAKKVFWINIYNAYNLILIGEDGASLKSPVFRQQYFNANKIEIAGLHLSLNFIEHSILRKSKLWWSKGYLSNPFASELEKKLRVEKLDFRIHFALNCGGASCPPIKFYHLDEIENQLELAQLSFMESNSKYNIDCDCIYISALLKWYAPDFGGKKGIRKLVHKLNLVPPSSKPRLKFSPYSWTFKENFSEH